MTQLLGMTDSDGFAISMIVILGVSFSFVLVIVLGIVRQARKCRTDTDELIEEVQREGQAQPAGGSPEKKKPEPWEQKADWWKKDS